MSQYQGRLQTALDDYIYTEAAFEERGVTAPRRQTHNVAFRFFHAQGQRGKGIGYQIDPQYHYGRQQLHVK